MVPDVFAALIQKAREAFAEDHDGDPPRTWDQIKDLVENYVKPILFAELSESATEGGIEDVDLRVAAERTVSRAMGGSCSMPLAAYADWGREGALRLDAAWGDPEGRSPLVRVGNQSAVTTLGEAEALGQQVAQALRAAGAASPAAET